MIGKCGNCGYEGASSEKIGCLCPKCDNYSFEAPPEKPIEEAKAEPIAEPIED